MALHMLVVVGDLANALERIITAPTPSPTADTNFAVTALYDRIPSSAFRFGSLTADPTLTFDLNIVTNGDMVLNSGGNVSSWTEANTGTGDVTYDATGGESAGAGMKFVSGTGTAVAYQDITARAGERLSWTVGLKGDGTRAVALRVFNRQTGKYWTGSAWSATPTDLATRTTATFATSTGALTVESAPAYRPDLQLMTLRVTLQVTTASGTCYADNCYVWPSVDIVSVHGHNIDPVISLELRRDTAAFAGAGTLEATITTFPLEFYSALGTIRDDRYWRLKFVGTNSAAIYLGEVVLAQRLTLTRIFKPPEQIDYIDDQVRSGEVPIRSYRRMDHPRRVMDMEFSYDTAAAFLQARDELVLRSRNGHHPMVIVPVDTETSCLYGKIEQVWSSSRVLLDGADQFYDGSPFRFVGLPLTSWVQ